MEADINLSQELFKSLNDFFSLIFSSIDNSLYTILDKIVFINPDILNNSYFRQLLGSSSTEGIILICNSLVLGFTLYYAINYLFSHLTYSPIESPKQFFFKAIIFISIMNSSLWICKEIINIVHIINQSIIAIGEKILLQEISFSNFIENLNRLIFVSEDSFNIISFDGIIKSFSTFGLLNLIFTYSLRYIMVQIFVLLSPFAFLSLITQKTSFFFNIWIKSFISLLLVQILISLILVLSFTMSIKSNDLLSKILYIGITYALLRSNHFVKELFGGISTDISVGKF